MFVNMGELFFFIKKTIMKEEREREEKKEMLVCFFFLFTISIIRCDYCKKKHERKGC